MTTLKTLADARQEILKAEVAALLHNLGKCSSAFIGQMTGTPSGYQDFSYQYIAGIVADWFAANQHRLSKSDRQRVQVDATKAALPLTYDFLNYEINGQNVRAWFQVPQIQLPAPLNDRKYAFGEFIEFHKRWHRLGRGAPARITLVYGSEPRVTALLHAAHDAASGGEKQEALNLSQQTHGLTQASAFGHEHEIDPEGLDRARIRLVEAVLQDQPDQQHILETSLHLALGDTQRPINEVSLWDLSASTAALFKAALSGAILDGWKPWPEVRWRLLHISFNGLAFWGQAHHVTDMLGRCQVLEDGLGAARDLLEVQYSLGNEVYRDEHGSVFVVPDADNLLELEDENGKSLKKLLKEAFDSKGIRGELVPEIEVSDLYLGKKIDLAGVLQSRCLQNVPRPDIAAGWWAEGQRPTNAEICTVCGQRPVGYVEPGLEPWVTPQKAKDRNVCGVCLHRRGRRAHDWARNVKAEDEKIGPFERTIWTDEVADDNGRFALVVGRFNLEGWLDGKLIPTMLKFPSFARIRRCWDTTRQFWLEVQDEEVLNIVGERLRLGIRSTNAPVIRKTLGRCHTYEAEVGGRRVGLCWDPNDGEAKDRDVFWTTDNLDYFTKLLGVRVDNLKARIYGWRLPLYERGGYLGQDRRADVDAEGCQVVREEVFRPFIPLMIEPATFMVLVPADKALNVARAIKEKYDREMARVRDRLPLHLGLVFAPRRTPLSAVLEAGRAMLEMPTKWEKWQIATTGRKAVFSRDGRVFEWEYPAKMGDNETNDIWYPHLLVTTPRAKSELSLEAGDFRLVDNLTGTVYVRPSRFDFEFLDTTARRFEIVYETSEVSETSDVSPVFRLSRSPRPFLLDDLDRLEGLWDRFGQLRLAQINQVVGAIEASREMWNAGPVWHKEDNPVFWQFVADTLAGANWPKEDSQGRDLRWHRWTEADRQKLIAAAASGELTDWAELHLQILKEKRKE